jgi:hypothetical protein
MRIRSLVAALFVLSLVCAEAVRVEPAGVSGKYQIRRIELAQDLGSHGVRCRVTLTNGLGIDVTLSDPADADRVLAMSQVFARGGRLFALVQDGEVKTIILDVGEPGGL